MRNEGKIIKPLCKDHLPAIKDWIKRIRDISKSVTAGDTLSNEETARLQPFVDELRGFLAGIGPSERFQAYHENALKGIASQVSDEQINGYVQAVLTGDRAGIKRGLKRLSALATRQYGIKPMGVYLGHLNKKRPEVAGEQCYRYYKGEQYQVATVYNDVASSEYALVPGKRLATLLHEVSHSAEGALFRDPAKSASYELEREYFLLDAAIRGSFFYGKSRVFRDQLYMVMPTEVDAYATAPQVAKLFLGRVNAATAEMMPKLGKRLAPPPLPRLPMGPEGYPSSLI